MILIPKPPSRNTYLIKFFPTWTYISAIWWLMVIDAIVDFGLKSFDGTKLRM
jgi:hypothetical protein